MRMIKSGMISFGTAAPAHNYIHHFPLHLAVSLRNLNVTLIAGAAPAYEHEPPPYLLYALMPLSPSII